MKEDTCRQAIERPPDITPGGVAMGPAFSLEAHIKKVANGFIVTVGCQKFVSQSWKEVGNALAEYWDDPRAAEKKYCGR